MRFQSSELILGCLLTFAAFSVGMTLFSGTTWLTKDAAGFFTFILAIVAALQAALFLWQLGLIRESLVPAQQAAKAAQDAAAAAKTQADSLMAAEGAHLYVIIKKDTIAKIFQLAGMYDNSPTMNDGAMKPPEIQYVLKNYGKTPAMLLHVCHGIIVQIDPGEMRTLVARDGALEIIGVGGESRDSVVRYGEPFKFGDARSLVTEDAVLSFFGEADYQDIFGATIHLEWEFIADRGVLHQIVQREGRKSSQG
jgi:hypothetical protein